MTEEPAETETAENDGDSVEDAEPQDAVAAFEDEPEFSEENAAPDEIVANDILMQSQDSESDTYDPMAAAEETVSDSDETEDGDDSANGFVINFGVIEHHITPDEFEDDDDAEDDTDEVLANVDNFLDGDDDDDNDDDDDDDDHPRHSRFRGFFKK